MYKAGKRFLTPMNHCVKFCRYTRLPNERFLPVLPQVRNSFSRHQSICLFAESATLLEDDDRFCRICGSETNPPSGSYPYYYGFPEFFATVGASALGGIIVSEYDRWRRSRSYCQSCKVDFPRRERFCDKCGRLLVRIFI